MPVPSETFVGRGRQNARALFNGLTRRCGGRQWVFTQPARDALHVERDCWGCLPRDSDYVGSAHRFAVCDGDKTRKPSRNGVTAFFDGWAIASY